MLYILFFPIINYFRNVISFFHNIGRESWTFGNFEMHNPLEDKHYPTLSLSRESPNAVGVANTNDNFPWNSTSFEARDSRRRDIRVPLFQGFPGKNPVIRRQNIPSVSTLLWDASYERRGCQRRGALALRPCRSPTPSSSSRCRGSRQQRLAQSRSSYRRARSLFVRVRSHSNIASVNASRRKCES